jgi:hypothetical protein
MPWSPTYRELFRMLDPFLAYFPPQFNLLLFKGVCCVTWLAPSGRELMDIYFISIKGRIKHETSLTQHAFRRHYALFRFCNSIFTCIYSILQKDWASCDWCRGRPFMLTDRSLKPPSFSIPLIPRVISTLCCSYISMSCWAVRISSSICCLSSESTFFQKKKDY